MASLYSQKDITYDPLYGCYFYKGKKLSEKQHKVLKHKIILAELHFKIDEEFNLCFTQKQLMRDLIDNACIPNDLKDPRAHVHKRFVRLVEYLTSHYEIKPKD